MIKKKNIILIILLFFSRILFAQLAGEAWNTTYKEIEARIKPPQFRAKDYNIKDFGAKANNVHHLNHEAINKAIIRCSKQGGEIGRASGRERVVRLV